MAKWKTQQNNWKVKETSQEVEKKTKVDEQGRKDGTLRGVAQKR